MSALSGGFATPPHDSALAFRSLMEAMARPGQRYDLTGATPPAPMSQAAGVLVLTLLDDTTPLYLGGAWDCPEVRQWIAFHTAARFTTADQATFALGDWAALQPVSGFALGDPAYPDRSATLIVELATFDVPTHRITSPGIAAHADLPLPEAAAFVENSARFPLGFDCFFTAASQVIGLPRSAKVEIS